VIINQWGLLMLSNSDFNCARQVLDTSRGVVSCTRIDREDCPYVFKHLELDCCDYEPMEF
jgi:hypothetical protein